MNVNNVVMNGKAGLKTQRLVLNAKDMIGMRDKYV